MRPGTAGQLATCLVIAVWLGVYALPYLVDQVRLWWLRRQLAREFARWQEQPRLYVPPAGSPHAFADDQWSVGGGRWAGPDDAHRLWPDAGRGRQPES